MGRSDHEANISDNALGTVASVEKALANIETRLESRREDLADHQRKREELGKHVGAPFEYEEKLAAATARQQEIVAALDLTKNQAGTQGEAGTAERNSCQPGGSGGRAAGCPRTKSNPSSLASVDRGGGVISMILRFGEGTAGIPRKPGLSW